MLVKRLVNTVYKNLLNVWPKDLTARFEEFDVGFQQESFW